MTNRIKSVFVFGLIISIWAGSTLFARTAQNTAGTADADTATGTAGKQTVGATRATNIPQAIPQAASPAILPPFMAQSMIYDRPDMMMRLWYYSCMDEAKQRWLARFEQLTDVASVERYQKRQRDFFLARLDLPTERTPLNPQITGTIDRKIFRVEKIVFESQPNFHVSAAIFLPPKDKFTPPYPAVVVPCGHSDNGKASEAYQRACMLGAMNGLAMLIVDPIDQGNRFQHLDANGQPYAISVKAHNLVAIGGIPLGRSAATTMIWDLMRAVDYLQCRNDIIKDRIGVMGNSGGGTQSAYLMALDERIACASPACYVSSVLGDTIRSIGPPDDEQLIFGQGDFVLEHADYGIIRAPKPTLLCTATRDFFRINNSWETFRQMKRVYGLFGLGDRMELIETDNPHGYTRQLREGAVRWMLRWLANRDEAIVEDETIKIFTDDELRCVPGPGVLALPGARTVHDLNRQRNQQFKAVRDERCKNMTPQAASEMVRRVARFRSLDELPPAIIRQESKSRHRVALEPQPGIFLPIKARWQKTPSDSITIVIDDQGRNSDFVTQVFAKERGDVLAVDLRGWGETQGSGGRHSSPEWFGPDRNEFYFAFLLGKTYVGMRTEDLYSVIQYCRTHGKSKFKVIARGGAATIAIHAAIGAPGSIQCIQAVEPLPDWNDIVEQSPCPVQLTDLVYGALKEYDKSNLRRLCGKICETQTTAENKK